MFCEDKKLANEKGVSPVIGVILVVAITVILAAVIGSFVFGFSGETQKAPQTTLQMTVNRTHVTLTHNGGDGIVLQQTKILINNGSKTMEITSNSTNELTIGDTIIIDITTTTNPITLDGNSFGTADTPLTTTSLPTGSVVRIRLIDTQTQRIFYNQQKTVL